jgi:acetylornithine/succinyldiaminopimelate/putrescine aminotransferase
MSAENNYIFKSISDRSLQIISDFNKRKKNTFLMPTKFISSEAGEVGYLLNEYFNWNRNKKNRVNYRTFFANSRFEAMQVAIKIARHNAFNRQIDTKKILLLDENEETKYFINPACNEEKYSLIQGIEIIKTIEKSIALVKQTKYLAVLIRNTQNISIESLINFLDECQKKQMIIILEHSNSNINSFLSTLCLLPKLPDIIVIGETLTDNEMPIGSISMSEEIHKPWASLQTCMMHSSTYAANNLVLEKAKEVILRFQPLLNDEIKNRCSKIRLSKKYRLKAFSKYINPGLVQLYKLSHLDVYPIEAHGSKLLIDNNKKKKIEIIDCVAGGGACIRGHTPEDIVAEVINTHDKDRDYWQELANTFKSLTTLEHAFPTVSGATAVDIGVTMALLADRKKRKILTFSGNYAGKNLLSLNMVSDEMLRVPFYPLYDSVIYINPFDFDAEKKLTLSLTSGEIALVWFEVVQGETAKEIPENLLRIINKYRSLYKYAIGIDEVFMGSFRCGRKFTYESKNIYPDIITLSKSLSDGTFPMGITLVSNDIFKSASEINQEAVLYYSNLYKNQFGAHIALSCVNKTLLSNEFEKHVGNVIKLLNQGFDEMIKKSELISRVDRSGLFFKLNYNVCNKITEMFNGYGALLFNFFVCERCLKEGNFIFFNECSPALNISENEAELFIQNLSKTFSKSLNNFYLGYTLFLLKISLFLFMEVTKHYIKNLSSLGRNISKRVAMLAKEFRLF